MARHRHPVGPAALVVSSAVFICAAATAAAWADPPDPPPNPPDPALAEPSPGPTGFRTASDPSVPAPPPQEKLPLGTPTGVPSRDGAAADGSGGGSWMLQTLTALGVVIALIFAVRLFLQRMGGAAPAASASGLIEVLARTPIAPRTHILFLRINHRVIVASQTSAGLQPLTELDDPDDVAWVLTHVQAARPRSISRGFHQLMHRFDRDYQPDRIATEEGGDRAEQFIDRTREELSGLLSRIRNLTGGAA